MVCRKVQVDRPNKTVSAGQSLLSRSRGVELEYPVDSTSVLDPIIAANPPIAAPFFEIFFGNFAPVKSCHELQTLHTFPSLSSISPGGRCGCVSFVVLNGSEPDIVLLLEISVLRSGKEAYQSRRDGIKCGTNHVMVPSRVDC